MKKLDYLWVMLMALIVSFSTVSCDDDDDNGSSVPKELVGSWVNEGLKIVINADGTGVMNEYGFVTNFTYSYSSNLLTAYFHDEEGDYTEQFGIRFPSKNQLILTDADGEELIFYREGTSEGGSETPGEEPDTEGGLTNGADYDFSVPVDLPEISDAYPEVSGEYEITNTDCGYEFIELMGDGNYLLKKVSDYSYMQKSAGTRKLMTLPVKHKVLTRDASISNNELIYGGYERISEDVYRLDGFGTLEVTKRNDDGNIESFVLVSDDGISMSLTVIKKEPVDDNTGYGKIFCRNWTAVEERAVYSLNGTKIYDAVHTLPEDQVYVFTNRYGIDWREESIFDTGDSALEKVLFSNNGTYLMIFKNEPMELSYWRWENKETGLIYAYDIIDGEIEGAVGQVKFSGKYLYVIEKYTENEGGQYAESVFTTVFKCN